MFFAICDASLLDFWQVMLLNCLRALDPGAGMIAGSFTVMPELKSPLKELYEMRANSYCLELVTFLEMLPLSHAQVLK